MDYSDLTPELAKTLKKADACIRMEASRGHASYLLSRFRIGHHLNIVRKSEISHGMLNSWLEEFEEYFSRTSAFAYMAIDREFGFLAAKLSDSKKPVFSLSALTLLAENKVNRAEAIAASLEHWENGNPVSKDTAKKLLDSFQEAPATPETPAAELLPSESAPPYEDSEDDEEELEATNPGDAAVSKAIGSMHVSLSDQPDASENDVEGDVRIVLETWGAEKVLECIARLAPDELEAYLAKVRTPDFSDAPPKGLVRKKKQTEQPKDLPHGEEFAVAWEEWTKYRKERKSSLTPTTIARQLKQLGKHPEATAVAMIDQSIYNGWTGIFAVGEQPPKPSIPASQAPELPTTAMNPRARSGKAV